MDEKEKKDLNIEYRLEIKFIDGSVEIFDKISEKSINELMEIIENKPLNTLIFENVIFFLRNIIYIKKKGVIK